MKFMALLLIILHSVTQKSAAMSCNLEGLIETSHGFQGVSDPVVIRFSFPNKYKKYEFSNAALQRNGLNATK